MCTVLQTQGVNPTAFNKCMNTSTYSLCVNVKCVTAVGCQPKCSYQMYHHINIQFVCKFVLCCCAGCQT